MKDEPKGLCFRCEYRAKFLETNTGPRFECGQIKNSVYGCYMYTPCLPLILKKIKGDKRSILTPSIIRARSEPVAIAKTRTTSKKRQKPQVELCLTRWKKRGTYMLTWEKIKDNE